MTRRILALVTIASLAACGGGSGSGGPLPSRAGNGAWSTSHLTFSFNAGTPVRSVTVTVLGAGASGTPTQAAVTPSSLTPSLDLAAISGNELLVTEEDATGATLGNAYVPAAPSIAFVENAAVHAVRVVAYPSTLTLGSPGATTLSLLATDASGRVILGTAPYSANGAAATFNVSAGIVPASGGVSASAGDLTPHASSFTAPGQIKSLYYNGGAIASATLSVSANASGVVMQPAASVTFTTVPVGVTIPGMPQITLSGALTTFATQMTSGPDGKLWAAQGDRGGYGATGIARIAPGKTPTVLAEYTSAQGLTGNPEYIATGADNDIWYVDTNDGGANQQVDKFPITSSPTLSVSTTGGISGRLGEIIAGPDGKMYVSDTGSGTLDQIDPASMTVTKIPVYGTGGYPQPNYALALGPPIGPNKDPSVCVSLGYVNGFSSNFSGVRCYDTVTHAFIKAIAAPSENIYVNQMVTGPDGLLYVYYGNGNGELVSYGTAAGNLGQKAVYGGQSLIITGLAIGSDGNVWAALWNHPYGFASLSIEGGGVTGRLNEYSYSTTALPVNASPACITLASDGHLYLCDAANTFIERINP